jgi:tetratricopeptide (TPR) repeat protein
LGLEDSVNSAEPCVKGLVPSNSIMKRLSQLRLVACVLACVVVALGCSRTRDPAKFLEVADKLYAERQLDKAKIQYLTAIELQRTNVIANRQLGKIFYRQGQYTEAYGLLSYASRQKQLDPEGTTYLATILFNGRNFSESRRMAMEVLAESPTNELALKLLSDTSVNPEEMLATLRLLEQFEKKVGPQPSFDVVRALVAVKRKDVPGAEADLKRALELNGKYAMAHWVLGLIRQAQRATNQAEQSFRAAAEYAAVDGVERIQYARYLKQSKRFDEAKKVLEQLNDKAPELIVPWVVRAEIAFEEKQFADCGKYLEVARAMAPQDNDMRMLYSKLALANHNPAQAIEHLQFLADTRGINTTRVGGDTYLGNLYFQLAVAHLLNTNQPNWLARGLDNLAQASILDTNHLRARIMSAELNLTKTNAPKALAILLSLVKQEPNLPRAHFLLAKSYVFLRQTDDALDVYLDMQKRFTNDPVAFREAGLIYKERAENTEEESQEATFRKNPTEVRNATARAKELLQKARHDLFTALRLSTREAGLDPLDPLEDLVDLELRTKNVPNARKLVEPFLARLDNPTEAATNITGSGTEGPAESKDKAKARMRLGFLMARIYDAESNLAKAEAELLRILDIDPNAYRAYAMLSDMYMRAGDLEGALNRLNALLAKDPKEVKSLMMKGIICSELKRYDEARAAYEKGLEANPNLLIALNNLAYLIAEVQNRVDEAYPFAKRARQVALGRAQQTAGEQWRIADTLGWIEYRRGDYSAAFQLINEADSALDPGFSGYNRAEPTARSEVAMHLGYASYQMGFEQIARDAFNKALKGTNSFSGRSEAEKRAAFLNQSVSPGDTQWLERLQAQLKEDPKDVIARLRLGALYEAAGNIDSARESYEAALKISPNSWEIQQRLAATEVEHDPARAQQLARQAQQGNRDDPHIGYTMGRLALRSYDASLAYGFLRNSLVALTNQPLAYVEFAKAAFAMGHLEEALEQLTKARSLGGLDSSRKAVSDLLFWLELGKSPVKASQEKKQIEAALKLDAENGPIRYALAVALEHEGKYSEARDAYERVVQRWPHCSAAVRQLAILYWERLKDPDKAYELATKARSTRPDDSSLRKLLGAIAQKRGDHRYAAQLLAETVRAQPEDSEAHYLLGMSYIALKRIPEGRSALEKAIALNPQGSFVKEAKRALEANKPG